MLLAESITASRSRRAEFFSLQYTLSDQSIFHFFSVSFQRLCPKRQRQEKEKKTLNLSEPQQWFAGTENDPYSVSFFHSGFAYPPGAFSSLIYSYLKDKYSNTCAMNVSPRVVLVQQVQPTGKLESFAMPDNPAVMRQVFSNFFSSLIFVNFFLL